MVEPKSIATLKMRIFIIVDCCVRHEARKYSNCSIVERNENLGPSEMHTGMLCHGWLETWASKGQLSHFLRCGLEKLLGSLHAHMFHNKK